MKNSANTLNWKNIRNFKKDEFPDGTLQYLDGRVVRMLDSLRELHGSAIYPTPLYEGFIRHSGSKTSQHYVGPKANISRLSTAADIFPGGDVAHAWQCATNLNSIGGVGIYLDTTFRNRGWTMMHVDIRERTNGVQTWWARVDGVYLYPNANTVHRVKFYEALLTIAQKV